MTSNRESETAKVMVRKSKEVELGNKSCTSRIQWVGVEMFCTVIVANFLLNVSSVLKEDNLSVVKNFFCRMD